LAAASVVAAYFVLLYALGGYWAFSKLMPVGGAGVSVQDFRDLTSAWDCARRGIAVLPVNPCSPVGGSANWPRLWLLPYHLGLGQSSTIPLVVTAVVAFLVVSILLLPPDAGFVPGIVYGLAVCSPAVMLGVYWGNIDIIVFVLVGSAALLLHRRRAGLIAGEALLLLASLLKLFPVVAIVALLRQRRRIARTGAVAIVACVAAYVLANYAYIALALRRTAQSDSISFGMRRFTEWLVAGVNSVSPRLAAGVNQHFSPRAWDVFVAVVILLILLLFQRKLRTHLPAGGNSQRELDLFWVGASIYVCAYVVFRSWDYRLVFVLLTIPQLLRWTAMKRAAAIMTLLALFGTLWLELRPPALGVFEVFVLSPWNDLTTLPPFHEPLSAGVLCQLVLFTGLLAGMIATAPEDLARPSR
jgi:hypothetical protein